MRVMIELLTHSLALVAVLQNTIVTRHRCGSPFVGGPSPSVPTNGRVLALKIQQIVAAQLLSRSSLTPLPPVSKHTNDYKCKH